MRSRVTGRRWCRYTNTYNSRQTKHFIIFLKHYIFRSQTDHLQLFQYRSIKNRVRNVNNCCEIYLHSLPCFFCCFFFRQNYRTTFSPTVPTSAAGISHVVADVETPGGEKWEHLKAGESNGKLPVRTCPGCSVPEPYQSPDWTLVSAQTGPRAEYL